MSNILPDRRIEHDWCDQKIPEKVIYGNGVFLESAQIFRLLRSEQNPAVVLGDHVSCYSGCSFSLGKKGRCTVGDYTLLNGALIMSEELIQIGSHCLISWNVGIADSDFHPIDPVLRRLDAEALAPYPTKPSHRPHISTEPVIIGDNVWIGMGAVILKGVSIGDNSVVAAGSIVTKSVPKNSLVAGNPAKLIKEL